MGLFIGPLVDFIDCLGVVLSEWNHGCAVMGGGRIDKGLHGIYPGEELIGDLDCCVIGVTCGAAVLGGEPAENSIGRLMGGVGPVAGLIFSWERENAVERFGRRSGGCGLEQAEGGPNAEWAGDGVAFERSMKVPARLVNPCHPFLRRGIWVYDGSIDRWRY